MTFNFVCVEANTSIDDDDWTNDSRFSFFQSCILIVNPLKSIRIVHYETLKTFFHFLNYSIIDASICGCTSLGFIKLTVMCSTTITTYVIDINTGREISMACVINPPSSYQFVSSLVVYRDESLCAVVKSKKDGLFAVVRAKNCVISQRQWLFLDNLSTLKEEPKLQLIDEQTTLLCTVGRKVFIVSSEKTSMTNLNFTPTTSLSLSRDQLTFCNNEVVRTLSLDPFTNDLTSRHSLVFDSDALKRYASYRELLYVIDVERRCLTTFVAISTQSTSQNSLQMCCVRVLNKMGLFSVVGATAARHCAKLVHEQSNVVEEEEEDVITPLQCQDDNISTDVQLSLGNLLIENPPPSADGASLLVHCGTEDDDDDEDEMVPFCCGSLPSQFTEKTPQMVPFSIDSLSSQLTEKPTQMEDYSYFNNVPIELLGNWSFALPDFEQ